MVLLADFTYTKSSKGGLVPPAIPGAGEVAIRSFSLLGGKRFIASEATTTDLLGGFRVWNLDGTVAVPLAGVALARDEDFVDPLGALRLNSQIATLNYRASRRLYLSAGYRHLWLDRPSGRASFDGSMSGPVVSAKVAFWAFSSRVEPPGGSENAVKQ